MAFRFDKYNLKYLELDVLFSMLAEFYTQPDNVEHLLEIMNTSRAKFEQYHLDGHIDLETLRAIRAFINQQLTEYYPEYDREN